MLDRCCVPGCGELMKPLCRFPLNELRQKEWLRVIRNPKLLTKSVSNIYQYYKICRKHFTDEAFLNSRFRNSRYRHKYYGFYGKINTAPTLHLPTEIKEDSFPKIFDLDNSELNLKEQIKHPVQKEYSKQDDIPMTYVESLIECADTKNNSAQDDPKHITKQEIKEDLFSNIIDLDDNESTLTKQIISPVQKEYLEQDDITKTSIVILRECAGPRTYQRTFKMEPIDNEQINVKKEKPFESYTEIEISDLHGSETFVSACNIKEESIDLEPNTKLYENHKEHVRDECEIFGKHVATKLKSYDQNTWTVVKNLIDDILFKAENGIYK